MIRKLLSGNAGFSAEMAQTAGFASIGYVIYTVRWLWWNEYPTSGHFHGPELRSYQETRECVSWVAGCNNWGC
jgi:hypothetical protein